LSLYTLIFQIALFLHSSDSSICKNISVFVMIVMALFTKFVVIEHCLRRSKSSEYTIFRIQSSVNLIYTSIIAYKQILSTYADFTHSLFIFPLICLIILTEIFSQYSDQMKPIDDNFFKYHRDLPQFLECVQYIVDDFNRLANT